MSWRDHMPRIPLDYAVPVLEPWTNERCIAGRAHSVAKAEHDGWIVDLDDPQGFGYALRWFWRADKTFEGHKWLDVISGWLQGASTDEHRVRVAEACANAMD